MSVKKSLIAFYRWSVRLFVFNKVNESIFFPKGYPQKINGEIIRLPFRYCRFYPKSYEVEKTELIHKFCEPGSTAIDIGAHFGVFSFFLAKSVGKNGKLYSFEPTPYVFNILRETIKYNKLGSIIEARQEAVINETGEIPFAIYKNSRVSNANSIYSRNLDDQFETIKVKATSLDNLMNDGIKKLSFIKIDAEGAELEILKGARTIIKTYKPVISLEIHPKSFEDALKSQSEIFEIIQDLGYNVYRDNKKLGKTEFCNFTSYFEVILKPSDFN